MAVIHVRFVAITNYISLYNLLPKGLEMKLSLGRLILSNVCRLVVMNLPQAHACQSWKQCYEGQHMYSDPFEEEFNIFLFLVNKMTTLP